jgi:ABC-type nitrate/sulfonate/bicarbonate transport system substrate-binding protein
MFNRKWILLWAGTMLLLAGCGAQARPEAAATPAELTKVNFMLDWVPNTNHTGLFVAQDKGWYQEAGLEVNIIQAGESPVEQVVASGSADFGISYQEAVTLARTEAAPIVSVAAVIQHNTSGFASRADRDILRPRDFEGKTYGGWGSPVEGAVLKLLMSCDGGEVNKVNILDTGYADFFAITEKEIDFAWIFYGWDGVNAELKGVPLNMIMLNEWQDCVPDYYTPVIITNEQTIAQKPELVKAFMGATAKGYQYAIEHPEEAAAILLKAAPESDPALLTASQKWLADQYQADAPRWGEQQEAVWQGYADWMQGQGLLSKKLDAAAAFTNNFLPGN